MMPINVTYFTLPNKVVANSSPVSYVKWRFWGTWGFIMVLVFLMFFAVMDIAPHLHGDEFMIVDIGRSILEPKSKWSITWIIERDQPVLVFFYLGPVLQEFAYQTIGQYGPRISGLIGAFVAATAMIGLLLVRGTPRYVALVLGLVFLLDPIFVQAYTMGRVDGWAMAFSLLSCWILREEINNNSKKLIFLSGALAALAFFIWPSAAFLFPLIVLELSSSGLHYSSIFRVGEEHDGVKRSRSLKAGIRMFCFLQGKKLWVICSLCP